MMKLSLLLLAVTFMGPAGTFCGSTEYPATVSFLIADYKYTKKEGVKICEIQSLGVSAISGVKNYKKLYKKGEISFGRITEVARPYFENRWMTKQGIEDSKIRGKLVRDGWYNKKSIRELKQDPLFEEISQREIQDSMDLTSYHGLLWAGKEQVQPIEEFKARHPGILIVDEFMFPHWNDKYKLTALFEQDPELRRYKPKWKCYPKAYTEDLANTILDEMGCNIVVIKPRSEYGGKGVCIVEKKDLDSTLKMIITKEGLPNKGKIAYWRVDESEDFLVEQFIESDGLEVKGKGHRRFDATYRMIFCVTSHQQEISVLPAGAFVKLPLLPVDQEGSFESRHKSVSARSLYIDAIPLELKEEMERQMKDCIRLYYRQVLRAS